MVTLLQVDGSGSRTCHDRKRKFPIVHNLVHEVAIGHGSEALAVASLPGLLQAKCNHSNFFRQMLQDIVRTHGSELSLVLAWDEAVPGNILQPDLRRKSALTYASLAQMIPWFRRKLDDFGRCTHQHASSIALGVSKVYDSLMPTYHE